MGWLKRVMALMPSCQHVAQLQSESLDHPLTLSQRLGMQLHLLACKWCRRYERQLHFLREAAHDYDPGDDQRPAETLSPEARERMKRRLREEEK